MGNGGSGGYDFIGSTLGMPFFFFFLIFFCVIVTSIAHLDFIVV